MKYPYAQDAYFMMPSFLYHWECVQAVEGEGDEAGDMHVNFPDTADVRLLMSRDGVSWSQAPGKRPFLSVGLAGGPKLETTVMPFILRGVSLVGIHSVECPQPWREQIWGQLSGQYKPAHLETIASETVDLAGVFEVCDRIMKGENTGRTVVDIQR